MNNNNNNINNNRDHSSDNNNNDNSEVKTNVINNVHDNNNKFKNANKKLRNRKRSRSYSLAMGNVERSSHHHNSILSYLPYIPILYWLPRYHNGWKSRLRGDLIGAITVTCMLVPQGMAYSLLAGLPPIYGLYASSIPLIIYSCLGTSRVQAIGPTAVDGLLTYSTLATILTNEELADDKEVIQLALVLAMFAGITLILMGIFRLGVIVNFLSYSVMSGFTTGAAVIILTSQFQHLLGIPNVPKYSGIGARLRSFYYVVSHLDDTNGWTVLISVMTILFLSYVRYWKTKRKASLAKMEDKSLDTVSNRIKDRLADLSALIATIVTGLWAYIYSQSNIKVGSSSKEAVVRVIGSVPPGLLAPEVPSVSKYIDRFSGILFGSAVIALVGFLELYSIGRVYAEQRRYRLDSNQELVGLGTANFIGSFFHSFPIGGSFSRTAVNAESGTRTLLANLLVGVFIIIALLSLSSLFYYIPMSCLASIIVVAIVKLIKYQDFILARRLHRKSDFYVMLITFICTISLSIQYGIATGVFLSMIVTLNHSAFPKIPVLGQVPGTLHFRNIHNEPNALTYDNVTILRLDAELYFANTDLFRKRIMHKAHHSKAIVIDASIMTSVDLQGIIMLKSIIVDLDKLEVSLIFANLRNSVRKIFFRSGVTELIGSDNIFMELSNAVFAAIQKSQQAPKVTAMVSAARLIKSWNDTQDANEFDDDDVFSSSSSSSSDEAEHHNVKSSPDLEKGKIRVSPLITNKKIPENIEEEVNRGEIVMDDIELK